MYLTHSVICKRLSGVLVPWPQVLLRLGLQLPPPPSLTLHQGPFRIAIVATRVGTLNSRTDLVLWDAVDAHGGDGGKHHADGEQTEELTGDGVARVLQGQPQTLPHTATAHLLKQLHVSDSGRGC